MITASLYFKSCIEIAALIKNLQGLPESIRPVYFGEDEGKIVKANLLPTTTAPKRPAMPVRPAKPRPLFTSIPATNRSLKRTSASSAPGSPNTATSLPASRYISKRATPPPTPNICSKTTSVRPPWWPAALVSCWSAIATTPSARRGT